MLPRFPSLPCGTEVLKKTMEDFKESVGEYVLVQEVTQAQAVDGQSLCLKCFSVRF